MKFIDKACWLEEEKILVIADLHLGYEGYLNEEGIFLPRFQYKKTIKDLDRIFKKIKVKEIIILGDLKHEFGKISKQEWTDVLKFLDYLKSKVKKIILIKGNHDTILEPIVSRKELEVKDIYVKGSLAFLHGHKFNDKVLDKKVKKIFLGHIHPAISIKEGVKSEIYKCFLVGKWKNKGVVILPSFFPLIEGSDVEVYDTNLDKKFNFNLKNFEVYVPVENSLKILEFGKVGVVGRLV